MPRTEAVRLNPRLLFPATIPTLGNPDASFCFFCSCSCWTSCNSEPGRAAGPCPGVLAAGHAGKCRAQPGRPYRVGMGLAAWKRGSTKERGTCALLLRVALCYWLCSSVSSWRMSASGGGKIRGQSPSIWIEGFSGQRIPRPPKSIRVFGTFSRFPPLSMIEAARPAQRAPRQSAVDPKLKRSRAGGRMRGGCDKGCVRDAGADGERAIRAARSTIRRRQPDASGAGRRRRRPQRGSGIPNAPGGAGTGSLIPVCAITAIIRAFRFVRSPAGTSPA
jgi:hypothetical protein